MNINELRYPIGQFKKPDNITKEIIQEWISDIKSFPERISNEVVNLTEEQLNWQYRPEGWNIRKVVHHCADSHINSITRFKLALTENKPKIRPYFEDRWAQLPDTTEAPVSSSLTLLKGLHERWVYLLENLSEEQLNRTYIHPEHNKEFTVKETIGLYAWHSNHHLAHVKQAKRFKGQF
jgi:hypothetical protein